MKYGYARVSTDDQKADLQIAALNKAGCEHVFTDTASGSASKRPELTRCLASLRAGDVRPSMCWRIGGNSCLPAGRGCAGGVEARPPWPVAVAPGRRAGGFAKARGGLPVPDGSHRHRKRGGAADGASAHWRSLSVP